LRAFSAVRSPIKGMPRIIEDRLLTAREQEDVGRLLEAGTSSMKTPTSAINKKKKKNKKGPKGPNWSEMELFSGGEDPAPSLARPRPPATTSLAKEIAEIVLVRLNGEKLEAGAPRQLPADRRDGTVVPELPAKGTSSRKVSRHGSSKRRRRRGRRGGWRPDYGRGSSNLQSSRGGDSVVGIPGPNDTDQV